MNGGYYADKQEGCRYGEQGQAGDGLCAFLRVWYWNNINVSITCLKMKLRIEDYHKW